ncbi:hypothetical protein [Variovorax sp. ZT4R33]|uniref:hypothetical protein n=1 Tax=Variovorax sp. ZT4R33 TaxID=3443743 RepID=UPI003F490615
MFSSSLLRLLSFPGLSLRRSPDRQLVQIRTTMLSLLEDHPGERVDRVAQRVRFADDMEALWYLRQDVLTTLAEIDGEPSARRQMRRINSLFKGGLPQTMGPRVHHRFTA